MTDHNSAEASDVAQHSLLSAKVAKQLAHSGQLASAQRFLEAALSRRKSPHVMVNLAHVMWLQRDVDATRALLRDTLEQPRGSAAAKIVAQILAVEMALLLEQNNNINKNNVNGEHDAVHKQTMELRALLARHSARSPCGWEVLAHGHLTVAQSFIARGMIAEAKVACSSLPFCFAFP